MKTGLILLDHKNTEATDGLDVFKTEGTTIVKTAGSRVIFSRCIVPRIPQLEVKTLQLIIHHY